MRYVRFSSYAPQFRLLGGAQRRVGLRDAMLLEQRFVVLTGDVPARPAAIAAMPLADGLASHTVHGCAAPQTGSFDGFDSNSCHILSPTGRKRSLQEGMIRETVRRSSCELSSHSSAKRR